jgi:hypothetical protein
LVFFHKSNWFFLIFKYKQIMILVSEKIKKKLCFWGYLVFFTGVLCN